MIKGFVKRLLTRFFIIDEEYTSSLIKEVRSLLLLTLSTFCTPVEGSVSSLSSHRVFVMSPGVPLNMTFDIKYVLYQVQCDTKVT